MRKTGILVWPGLFWVLAFLLPLSAVALRAAGAPGALSGVLASPYYRSIFEFTIYQAGLSTLFSVLIGLPGAWIIARFTFPGRRLLKSLTTVPFVLPPILAVLGFILVFGNSGLINNTRDLLVGGDPKPWKILYSLKAIIMAHVFYNFPLTMRIAGDAWSNLSQSPNRAARSLGAGPVRTFLRIDVPRLLPSILTSALLTFIYCFMSFTIILILGGGPQLSTIEVEVYRLVKYSLDFSAGSALALIETLFILILMGIYSLVNSRSSRWLKDDAQLSSIAPRTRITGIRKIAVSAYLLPALLLIVTPLLAVIFNSFLGRTTRTGSLQFTLSHWQKLFTGGRSSSMVPLQSVGRTIILSLSVSAVTVVTASMTAWYSVGAGKRGSRIVETLVSAPLAVSSVILGLGYLIIANRIPDSTVIRIGALVMVHTILALPFAHRIISDRLRNISPRIHQAARSSGASPFRSLIQVELPLARKALVTAAVFSMALSAGEMNATLILSPRNFTTIPLAIYRMIGAYDVFGACALGSVLILVSAAAFFVLDRFAEESE